MAGTTYQSAKTPSTIPKTITVPQPPRIHLVFVFIALDSVAWANVELVRPLPAIGEDELVVRVQTRTDDANTAAGSGLHEATCWPSAIVHPPILE